MTQGKMTMRSKGRGIDLDQPHIDASVELRNIPLGIFPSSGDPIKMFGMEQRIDTLTREIIRLEQLVYSLSQQVESLQAAEPEETSEILELRPLSEKRVNVKIQKREAARFHYVGEDEE